MQLEEELKQLREIAGVPRSGAAGLDGEDPSSPRKVSETAW